MRRSNLIAALAAGVFALASHQALAGADLAKGEKLFKRCKTCHSLEEGKKKVGPSLFGLFGRTAGSVEGYKYSKAMKESGIVWDEEAVYRYFGGPPNNWPRDDTYHNVLRKWVLPSVELEALLAPLSRFDDVWILGSSDGRTGAIEGRLRERLLSSGHYSSVSYEAPSPNPDRYRHLSTTP